MILQLNRALDGRPIWINFSLVRSWCDHYSAVDGVRQGTWLEFTETSGLLVAESPQSITQILKARSHD